MRRLLILSLLLFSSFSTFAQLEVKEGSFKEVPGFVNINPDDNYQTDDNNLPFAVIKIRTENINDKQRRELKFSGNAGTFIMLEYKDGEVWVYLTAQYADYLKISHPDYSSIEFTLPYDLKPKCGYEMTLVNKPSVDEDIVKRLEKLENTNNNVDVNQIEKEGYITVKSTPKGAFVLIDNKIVGTTPYLSESLAVGNHKVSVNLEGYEPEAKRVIIEENKDIEVIFKLVKEDDIDKEYTVVQKPNTEYIFVEDSQFQLLYGEFSVSLSKTVYFSKGNLQYNKSTKNYKFAEKQWTIVGDGNIATSTNDKGWTDLFKWQEISATTNIENKIWRILTKEEWEYLLNKRKTNSGERYAKAIVDNVKGIILLPDNWNTSYYELNNTNKFNGMFSKNNITVKDWYNIFEANGAVFLPAAGSKNDDFVRFVGVEGNYWSATAENDSRAYLVNFDDAYLGTTFGSYQWYNYSIRLVCDVE